MSIVTCHTDGCPNQGIGIKMNLTFVMPESGMLGLGHHEVEQSAELVLCGGCSKPITDIEES